MNAAQAFIAYLRCEAVLADERAKSLRATAAAIEANVPSEGSVKRKKRRREEATKPNGNHNAYTVYVSEHFESIKSVNGGNVDSKEVHAALARQWERIDEQERQAWQYKADQLKQAEATNPNMSDVIEELGLSEPPLGDDWINKKPAAKKDDGREADALTE